MFTRRKTGGTKKHKTWEGDGLLHQHENVIRLLSEDGTKEWALLELLEGCLTFCRLSSKTYDIALEKGLSVWMGNKEVPLSSKCYFKGLHRCLDGG